MASIQALNHACRLYAAAWQPRDDDRAIAVLGPIAARLPPARVSDDWAEAARRIPLEAIVRGFVDHPDMQAIVEAARAGVERGLGSECCDLSASDVAGAARKGGAAFLAHRFFWLLDSGHAATVIRALSARADRDFGWRVAATIGLGDPRQLLASWEDFGLWLFQSLALGRQMPLRDASVGAGDEKEADVSDEEASAVEAADPEEDDDKEAGAAAQTAAVGDLKPLWWDLDYSLDMLVSLFGLGQGNPGSFWSNGFLYSPVGRMLQATGLAERLLAQVRVVGPCTALTGRPLRPCGHQHVSLGDHGCTCETCKTSPPRFERRPWLVSADAIAGFTLVLRFVCSRCRRVQTGPAVPACRTCGRPMRLGRVPSEDDRLIVVWVCRPCEAVEKQRPEIQCTTPDCRNMARPRLLDIPGGQVVALDEPIDIGYGELVDLHEIQSAPRLVTPEEAFDRRRKLARLKAPTKAFYCGEVARERMIIANGARTRRGRTGARTRLLVQASLTPLSIEDAIFLDDAMHDTSRVPEGWELEFLQDLYQDTDRESAIARIETAKADVCARLGIDPGGRITTSHYGITKWRLKRRWELFRGPFKH